MKKILVVGHGRSGKDTAIEFLDKISVLKSGGTTSLYLAKYVAQELGVDEAEAYRDRHEPGMREVWFKIGNKVREQDPCALVREALGSGADLIGGIRGLVEIEGCRKEKLFDLIIWIENNRVPVDPTLKFDVSYCDIIIENNGTLSEFHEKLERFAKFAGIIDHEYMIF